MCIAETDTSNGYIAKVLQFIEPLEKSQYNIHLSQRFAPSMDLFTRGTDTLYPLFCISVLLCCALPMLCDVEIYCCCLWWPWAWSSIENVLCVWLYMMLDIIFVRFGIFFKFWLNSSWDPFSIQQIPILAMWSWSQCSYHSHKVKINLKGLCSAWFDEMVIRQNKYTKDGHKKLLVVGTMLSFKSKYLIKVHCIRSNATLDLICNYVLTNYL